MLTTQKRLELSTSAVTGRRSNQLSHWAIYIPSKLHTRNYSSRFNLSPALVMPSTD